MTDYKLPYHPLRYKGKMIADGIRESEFTYDATNKKIIIGNYTQLNPKLLEALEKAGCPYEKASFMIHYSRVNRRKDDLNYDAYFYILMCNTADDEWRVYLEPTPFSHRYCLRNSIEKAERDLQEQQQEALQQQEGRGDS